MGTHRAGLGFEDRLVAYLTRQQFDIDFDPTLDHEYKIDLVIRKFPNNPKFHSMGLQVTTHVGQIQKLQEFAAVHSGGYRVVDKVMYVEVDPKPDFEKGVGHLIATGISEFQFSTRHQNEKVAGLRINPDMTYTIFDISAELTELAKNELQSRVNPARELKAPVANMLEQKVLSIDGVQSTNNLQPNNLQQVAAGRIASPPKLKLKGFINAYYRTKDHGFITAQTGDPYFFSLTGVADGELRDKLLALPQLEGAAPIDGTVEFEDVGKTRPSARYPEAKVVRLAK